MLPAALEADGPLGMLQLTLSMRRAHKFDEGARFVVTRASSVR